MAAAFDRYAPMTMEAALASDQFDEMIAFEIEPHLGTTPRSFCMTTRLLHAPWLRPGRISPTWPSGLNCMSRVLSCVTALPN
ncbi:MAG: hypothetical protein R2860_12370 [Desulfobacterales bacterium]